MMRLLFLSLAFLGWVLSCTSRTVPGQRFEESRLLTAPVVAATPPDAQNFTFAFVGDTHVGQDTHRLTRILSEVRSEGDAFVILLGDLVDEGKRDSFSLIQSVLSEHGFRNLFLPVIGNHDIFEDGWTHYRELLGPSHYTVDFGNSRFIALDTADGTVDHTQFDWLKNQLQQERPPNTFLLSHYLPLIPGQRTYLKLANEEEALRLMKLVRNHEITAWLGAHYHSYVNETVEGIQYVVAGGGGGRRMEPLKDYFFVQARVSGTSVSFHPRLVE